MTVPRDIRRSDPPFDMDRAHRTPKETTHPPDQQEDGGIVRSMVSRQARSASWHAFVREEDNMQEFIARVQRVLAEQLGIVVSPVVVWDPDLDMYRVQFEIMSTLH